MRRREIFSRGEIFHICNKSISNFGIFKSEENSQRFLNLLDYYNDNNNNKIRFSDVVDRGTYVFDNILLPKVDSLIKFLCYCIMPDHYHLLIKIIHADCLSHYIGNIENSFTRYFNIKFNRQGPLWQSRFRAVRITSDEQLLHVSRYAHLNSVTAGLVNKPEDWKFSSYRDIISDDYYLKEILTEFSITDKLSYQKFVNDNIDYQKKLKMIKRLILEDANIL